MKHSLFTIFSLTLLAGLAACGDRTVSPEDGGDSSQEQKAGVEGAKYSEGKGVFLLDETKKSIGLKVAEVEERQLASVVPLEAQIYRAANEPSRSGGEQTGAAYASALLAPNFAATLKTGDPVIVQSAGAKFQGSVWKIETATKAAVANEEVILQIADPDETLRVGSFVSGEATPAGETDLVVTVPRSAVLETATGKFTFVANGEAFLRTPVATGVENADYTEITDGLYAGDVVASTPAETLYLIELRATKGGGHCH